MATQIANTKEMKQAAYTRSNFMHGTYAVFKGCEKPARPADYVSESGSQYWYGENNRGKWVIRYSDHWSGEDSAYTRSYGYSCRNIASCYWPLKSTKLRTGGIFSAGKAFFKDFKPVKWR